MRAVRALPLLAAGCLVGTLAAPPAFADSRTRIEIDPDAPLAPGETVVLVNPPLAALLSAALPLAAVSPLWLLKPAPAWTQGLVFGAPLLAGTGDLYGGDAWHALMVGLTGPAFVAAGLGVGLLWAQVASPGDAAARALLGGNGMWWGYGLYVGWAAADAYVTADLHNKRLLRRAGVGTDQ
jgi:hypothetical protein